MHIPTVFGVSVVTIFLILIVGVYIQKNYSNNPLAKVANVIPVV